MRLHTAIKLKSTFKSADTFPMLTYKHLRMLTVYNQNFFKFYSLVVKKIAYAAFCAQRLC